MFDQVDVLVRDYDESKYLVLFEIERYQTIFDIIRYLVWLKSRIAYFDFIYPKIQIDSADYLPLQKTLMMHNFVILDKSDFDKNSNPYCYKGVQEYVNIS